MSYGMLLQLLILFVFQGVLRYFWFTKILVVDQDTRLHQHIKSIYNYFAIMLYTLVVYLLTQQIFFILTHSFFYIILCIMILVGINSFDILRTLDDQLTKNTILLWILYIVLSTLSSVLISLIILT